MKIGMGQRNKRLELIPAEEEFNIKMKIGIGRKLTIIIILQILLLLALLFGCTFDYDNDYINEPPDSVIGTPCYNIGDQIKYTYGQYYYCAECMYVLDRLEWTEMNCNEFEGEK